MKYAIKDETGAFMAPEGHWNLHPEGKIGILNLDAANRKVEYLKEKGIKASIVKVSGKIEGRK